MTSGSGSQGIQQRRSTKVLCGFLAMLMLGVWGVAGTPKVATAAVPLAAPVNLSPNGTPSPGNPMFSWNAVSGATYYRVTYPNANGVGTTTTTTYANSFSPPTELPLGSISWSVLANNGVDGTSASASFTKNQAVAPTLTCPGPIVNYPGQAPTFTWNAIPGMKTYTLLVSSAENFPNGTATQTYKTQSTSFTLTAGQSDGQTFYAQVSGQSAAGLNTLPSEKCSYQVVWSTTASNVNDAQPTLLSPKNHNHLRDVILKWAPLTGAARYELQVSGNGDWTNNLLYDIVTDATVWSPAKTLNNGSYYWRLRGLDNAGNASRWSDYPSNSAGDAWEFTIDPLTAPTRVSPIDNTTISNPNFKLSWNPVPGAGAYEVQVSTNASFSGAGVNQTCFTTHTDWSPYTYENPPGNPSPGPGNGNCAMNRQDQSALTSATTLYWQVRALDNFQRTEVADPFSTSAFTTTNIPPSDGAFFSTWSTTGKFFFNSDAPALVSPADGASVTVPTMTWSRVAGTEHYEVQVTAAPWNWNKASQTCLPGSGSTKTYKTAATSLTPSLLPSLRKYPKPSVPGPGYDDAPCPVSVTWTVLAVDHSKRSSPLPYASSFTWSGYTSTGLVATPDPVAPSPASGATVNTTPTFKWSPVSGADHYEVWWFDNPTGSTHVNLIDYNYGVGSKFENPMTESFTPVQPLPVTVTSDNPTGYGAWQIAAIDGANSVMSLSARQNLVVTPPTDVTITSFTTRTQAGAAVVCGTGCLTPSTPLISWTGNPDASYYRVFIAQDQNFTNVIRVYDTSNTSIRPVEALPDVQAGQSYYVLVQPAWDDWYTGTNSVGTIRGAYNSSVIAAQRWSFRKQSSAITGMKTLDPSTTVSVNSNNACDDAGSSLSQVSDSPTFCWNDSSTQPYASGDLGAMRYHIQVSTSSDFANIIDQALVDQPSYTPYVASTSGAVNPGVGGYRPTSIMSSVRDFTYPDGPLYWRVQAVDATNNGLTYSSAVMTTKLSTAVTPQSPTNNANVPRTPSLRWSAKPFAASYNVEVYRNDDTAASPGNKAFAQSTDLTAITPTNNNVTENGTALPAGTYAWRVRGVDANGNSASWSGWQHFTVDPTIVTPLSLLTPTNIQSFTSQSSVVYTWQPVDGAVTYKVYVSSASSNPKSNSNMGSRQTVMSSYTPEVAFPATPPLSNKIYWQVEALDGQNAVIATSAVGSFTYNGSRPTTSAPTVVTGPSQVTLYWTASASTAVGLPILNYVITPYLNNVPQATTTVSAADAGPMSGASHTLTGLTNGSNYAFSITAVDANGPGPEGPRANGTPNLWAPFSSKDNCIRKLYSDLQGVNSPSAAQMQSMQNYMGTSRTCADVAAYMWQTGVFQDTFPIARLYQAYFLRIPDFGGLDYWIGLHRGPKKYKTSSMSDYFAQSLEFKSTYGNLSNGDFVALVYQNVLGRDGKTFDPSGYNYWLGKLNTKRINRGQLMLLFSESAEYVGTQMPTIKAELLVLEFLRRTPTQTEVNSYKAKMSSSNTYDSQVLAQIKVIMATTEYRTRAT